MRFPNQLLSVVASTFCFPFHLLTAFLISLSKLSPLAIRSLGLARGSVANIRIIKDMYYKMDRAEVTEREWTTVKIGEMISLDSENDKKKINFFSIVLSEFFEDMKSSWRGRVKRMHIEEEFEEVERVAETLSLVVSLQKSLDACNTLLRNFVSKESFERHLTILLGSVMLDCD
ncbi:hypothetical protein FNV43_RR19030 [Rhamnella rubrinervis]|uniref:Uncharacterized protein n=1 Tax=Rhamnella rubrinervis TaxID=2594499 RepID=A0A8K0E748_9ROSA|nr:hypothetical protein FNV43_RR19030 [Rhamnella rubrinervis]